MARSPNRLSVLARPAFSNIARNPYNATVYRNIDGFGIDIHDYSVLRALGGRYHVVHLHWPESVFNHHLAGSLPTTEGLLWLLRWQRMRGAKVVWTVHNLRAHDSSHRRFEERFWGLYLALVDGYIALQPGALTAICDRFPQLRERPHWVVPHPHYRGHYPDNIDRAEARARLGLAPNARTILFFGRLHPYKNVPALIRAFKTLRDRPDRQFQLIVAGAPKSRSLAESLKREARGDSRIRLELRFIEPAETQDFFRASDLVVLPYREILNSGSALLALSFDRPVLLPRSGYERDLADAIPGPWVLNFEELTSSVLESALATAETLPERSDGTHLTAFDPSRVSAATAAAYRELVQRSASEV